MHKTIFAAVLAALAAGAPLHASAAAVFTFTETGGNVVGQLRGSLDLTGAVRTRTQAVYGSGIGYSNVFPSFQLQASDDAVTDGNFWSLSDGALPGTRPDRFFIAVATSTGTTAKFEINFGSASSNTLALPLNYLSGSALDRTLTFANMSFQGLGIPVGDYVYTLAGSGDTVTLRFQNATAVPEPGGLALTGLALGAIACVRRRTTPAASQV